MDGDSDTVVALLSIHPRFADAILDGRKHVEFRRATYAARATHVALYATAPVRRVVGVFRVGMVDRASPEDLWARHSADGAVTLAEFMAYYHDAVLGTAIGITEVMPFDEPVALSVLDASLSAPQCLRYLSPATGDDLLRRASASDRRYAAGSIGCVLAPVLR